MNSEDQFIPHLVVSDGLAALEFYKTAFAAEEGDRMFWAARYRKILDPFGHEWGINQQVKEQSAEETQRAADEFLGKRG